MLPVEIGETTLRQQLEDVRFNEECMKKELDLLEELRDKARIREVVGKQHVARRHNSKIKPRAFQPGHLVWQMTGDAQKYPAESKFVPNWEGPYRVAENLENESYRLEQLSGEPILITWNVDHLKCYYS